MPTAADLRVAVATMADREAIARFLSRAATDENIETFDVLGLLPEFRLPVAQVEAGQLLMAVSGWSIVGMASVVFRQEGGIAIDAMLIAPEIDRDEIGRRLIVACETFARTVSAKALFVTVREESLPLVEGWGFARVGIDEAVQGSVAVVAKRDVLPSSEAG